MAHYGDLTQLTNRTLFTDRSKQAIAHSKRNERLVVLSFLDLDNFKPINDNYGHDTGDKILIEVAKRLKATIREEDTASRLGGDEFSLLLGDIDSLAQCEQLLVRIVEEIAKPYIIDEITLEISVSLGATVYPTDNSDFDIFMRHADQVMYQAKLTGKNKYIVFDPTQASMDGKYH